MNSFSIARRMLAAAIIAGAASSWLRPAPLAAGNLAAIDVVGPAGSERVMTEAEIATLPPVRIEAAFETEHGQSTHSYEGPLLWTVLVRAGAIDQAKPREQVRQSVLLTGSDGYTAVLALGEIAPAFEGKQVIVAQRADGQALPPYHMRIVVPGDKRGGRSIRDLARIAVQAAPTEKQ